MKWQEKNIIKSKNKYILDKNYCSDFKEEDINDSDISYDFNEVIQEVAKKNKIEKGSTENFYSGTFAGSGKGNVIDMKDWEDRLN